MIQNEIITFNITDNAIAELSAQYTGLVASFGDTRAEKQLREAIAVLRDYRVQVEHRRKELKADALEYGKKVDAEAKRITENLLKIEEPLKANKEQIDAERERIKEEKRVAEVKRIETIQKKIFAIKELVFKAANEPIEEIRTIIDILQENKISQEEYQEFFKQAWDTYLEVSDKLGIILMEKQKEILKKKEREQEELKLKEERAKLAAEKKANEEEKALILQEREKLAREQAEAIERTEREKAKDDFTTKENLLNESIVIIPPNYDIDDTSTIEISEIKSTDIVGEKSAFEHDLEVILNYYNNSYTNPPYILSNAGRIFFERMKSKIHNLITSEINSLKEESNVNE